MPNCPNHVIRTHHNRPPSQYGLICGALAAGWTFRDIPFIQEAPIAFSAVRLRLSGSQDGSEWLATVGS
jgi:hypothetical protein